MIQKKDLLKNYTLTKLDDKTVFIRNKFFEFSYTNADDIVKEEFKGQYRYFGGLQCEFEEGTEAYKNIETWLCEIAEKALTITRTYAPRRSKKSTDNPPKYEVIGQLGSNDVGLFTYGQIITLDQFDGNQWFISKNGNDKTYDAYFELYPETFKRLN